MKNLVLITIFFFSVFARTQQQKTNTENDSILPFYLKEVIIIGKRNFKKLNNQKETKLLATLDEFLEKSSKITMIKRGNYAWEPAMNNMTSDRISVTIDGMQIFGACTDKMDPITSYVDTSNLSEAHISSGQQGAENGQTIGGGIDLKLDRNNFEKEGTTFNMGLDTGFETNASSKILGTELNYSTPSFFINTDFIYRNAENYFDGNSKEVQFSQFTKYNFSVISGIKIAENKALVASLIYDEARDIGYPALPMDVSLARAVIGSVSYEHKDFSSSIKNIEAKIYANKVTHIMDDTTRPNVAIHMDMPGWSTTYGGYLKTKIHTENHSLLFNLNTYYNRSLAEMTMYPKDPSENLMFMLTWPNVQTLYSGFYAEDVYRFTNKSTLKFTTRIGLQNARIADKFGLGSLQIFYPKLKEEKTRFLPSLSIQYSKTQKTLDYTISAAYGERAPSVSEGYGNFLYNNFDNFDYIGNPYLKNEKAFEFNANSTYKKNLLTIKLANTIFFISNYIIGEINPAYSPMVIGASGVKVYGALDNVVMFNSALSTSMKINNNIDWKAAVGYNYGKDTSGNNLPLIAPISFSSTVSYRKNSFNASIKIKGEGNQTEYSPVYGEDQSKSYTIFNGNAGYTFYINTNKILIKGGFENLFNRFYSTYSDWNNIPRMGRNVFLNMSYVFK
ncbi:MAG: TonB-dependent receptor [Cellulophaga sp.]